MNIKKFVIWVLPFILLVLFGGLEVAGVFTRAEHAVYDAWLHLKPEVEQREEILFLDVDDLSIARVGVWPWSRDIMARGLLALKEFDSGPVVFDIEYVDASPLAVDGQVLRDQLPSAFSREFGDLTDSVGSLLQAIGAGQIPPQDAPDFSRTSRIWPTTRNRNCLRASRTSFATMTSSSATPRRSTGMRGLRSTSSPGRILMSPGIGSNSRRRRSRYATLPARAPSSCRRRDCAPPLSRC
jgi:hypothetical protein